MGRKTGRWIPPQGFVTRRQIAAAFSVVPITVSRWVQRGICPPPTTDAKQYAIWPADTIPKLRKYFDQFADGE